MTSPLRFALSGALALLAPFAGGPAAADPNQAFRPYQIPADVGATMQLMLGVGQVQGALSEESIRVEVDPETGCTQYVGGVQLEEGTQVLGDVESNTVVQGTVLNVCR